MINLSGPARDLTIGETYQLARPMWCHDESYRRVKAHAVRYVGTQQHEWHGTLHRFEMITARPARGEFLATDVRFD